MSSPDVALFQPALRVGCYLWATKPPSRSITAISHEQRVRLAFMSLSWVHVRFNTPNILLALEMTGLVWSSHESPEEAWLYIKTTSRFGLEPPCVCDHWLPVGTSEENLWELLFADDLAIMPQTVQNNFRRDLWCGRTKKTEMLVRSKKGEERVTTCDNHKWTWRVTEAGK